MVTTRVLLHHTCWGLLIAAFLAQVAAAAGSGTPAHSYKAIYGTVTCYADAVIRPNSTAQLAAALRSVSAAAAASNKQLKVRATRSIFHSAASFPCVGKSSLLAPPSTSSAAPSTVVVLTESLNQVVAVDEQRTRVRAGAGMLVSTIAHWAEDRGWGVDIGSVTNYGELTLGGVISASGHGTGQNVISSPADTAVQFTWVDVSGKVRNSSRNSEEGRTLAGGVGVVGIITEVTLQFRPALTYTKAVTTPTKKDTTLAADIEGYIKDFPNMAIMWRPDLGIYNAFLFNYTSGFKGLEDSSGIIFPLPTLVSNSLQLMLLPWQKDVNDTLVTKAIDPLMCAGAAASVAVLKWSSKGLPPVALPQFFGEGRTSRIMAGTCEPKCVWNSELTTDDSELAISRSDLPSWIEDAKRIFKMDLQDGGSQPLKCLSTGYVFMRFGRTNQDAASPASGLKDPVYVELTSTRSRKLPDVPGKYSWMHDILEQRTLCRYKGRPHWGKNFDRTFTSAACPLRNAYPNFDLLLKMQAKYDPNKSLEPELMSRVINRAGPVLAPRCAATYQCYCRQDQQCAPGWRCVASKAFPDIKTCKPAGVVARQG